VNPEEGPSTMSHDGKRLAVLRLDLKGQADLLKVRNADGTDDELVATRKWPTRFFWNWAVTPVWTPDDQSLRLPIISSDAQGFYVTIAEFNASDHSEHVIPLSPQRFEQPSDITLLKD